MKKIVILNTYDNGGGAAIAAIRHNEAFIRAGYDSHILVMRKRGYRDDVTQVHLGVLGFLVPFYRFLFTRIRKILKPIGVYSPMSLGLPVADHPLIKDADIVFIHWVNDGFLSVNGVRRILKLKKPVFFYMHDMADITGGCHHSLSCDNYIRKCDKCPLITSCRQLNVAKHQFNRKLKKWAGYPNLSFVAPSNWLGECVKNSKIAQGHHVFVAPNVIDVDLFKPLSIDTKELLGLDPSKKTILFSADLSGSVYKGAKFTIDCIKGLDPSKYEGLVIGNISQEVIDLLPVKVVSTGYLLDSISLVMAYNACDTAIVSSVAENYPNVILEAMACGRPCIGFNTGGIPDLIVDGVSGYLVTDKCAESLTEKIEMLFSDDARYRTLAQNARSQIVRNNSYANLQQIYRAII